jgi:hypothetical protein
VAVVIGFDGTRIKEGRDLIESGAGILGFFFTRKKGNS